MLETLFGNKTKEQVLLYLYTYQEGYANEIRKRLGLALRAVQLQLKQLEQGGVLLCRKRDRTHVYQLNTRYFFYSPMVQLLERLLEGLPSEVKKQYFTPRLRPRRLGKPL